jgi:hypothetical protein
MAVESVDNITIPTRIPQEQQESISTPMPSGAASSTADESSTPSSPPVTTTNSDDENTPRVPYSNVHEPILTEDDKFAFGEDGIRDAANTAGMVADTAIDYAKDVFGNGTGENGNIWEQFGASFDFPRGEELNRDLEDTFGTARDSYNIPKKIYDTIVPVDEEEWQRRLDKAGDSWDNFTKGAEQLGNSAFEAAVGIYTEPTKATMRDINLQMQKNADTLNEIKDLSRNLFKSEEGETVDSILSDGVAYPSMLGDSFNFSIERKKRYGPVEMIRRIGPDLMSNKFDAFFMWNFGDMITGVNSYSKLHAPWHTDAEKQILSHKGFAVRFKSISIPAVYNNTHNVSFLEQTIERISSSKTNENEASFTFRLDQDLVWLDEFQLLSGRRITQDGLMYQAVSSYGDYTSPEIEGLLAEGVTPVTGQSYKNVMRTIAKTWNPIRSYNLADTHLSLVIMMNQLGDFYDKQTQTKRLPFFVFEHVKFLGPADSVTYSRETAETQDMTFKFIFRRLYKVMIPASRNYSRERKLEWNSEGEKITGRATFPFDLKLRSLDEHQVSRLVGG